MSIFRVGCSVNDIGAHVDLAIVLGGDGTMLTLKVASKRAMVRR